MQNEIIVGLVKSLEEVKRPWFATKSATKHVLLIATISSNGQSTSLRQKTHVLGVHHCNISYVVQGQRLMDFVYKETNIWCFNTCHKSSNFCMVDSRDKGESW